jgi:hypothetical protein
MNKVLFIIFCLVSSKSFAQKDTTKWVRAFPITDYITNISDSMKIVQVNLPHGVAFADKQIGLLKGMYRVNRSDTGTIGAGKCHLIKGDYYYFTINVKQNGKQPKAGDLLYTFMDKTPVHRGNIISLACQYIGLLDVYEKPLYDRYNVFSKWTLRDEEALMDSIVSDIHFTGNYFIKNNPEMNVSINDGNYKGKPVLDAMITCSKMDVINFLEYMVARPILYAGHEWKISEVFATWLTEGAPTVLKK